MKNITIQSRTYPDEDIYGDTFLVIDNNHIVFACVGSACPNPHKPFNFKLKWEACYGFINVGTFYYKCIYHWKFGKCILINDGKEVNARAPNLNHGGKYFMKKVYIHKGYKSTWRGSAGCLTIHPELWHAFIWNFKCGDTGKIIVREDEGL